MTSDNVVYGAFPEPRRAANDASNSLTEAINAHIRALGDASRALIIYEDSPTNENWGHYQMALQTQDRLYRIVVQRLRRTASPELRERFGPMDPL